MKRIILLAGMALWAVTAQAQYVPEWHQGELSRKGAAIALNGEKLDRETTRAMLLQAGGEEWVSSWDRSVRQRNWGTGLTAGGYTLAVAGFCYGGIYMIGGVVGSIFAAIGGQEAVDKLWDDLGPRVQIGGVATLVGLAAGTTGVVLLVRGNKKLTGWVKACDAAGLPPAPAVELSFGPAPSGVGLSLRF